MKMTLDDQDIVIRIPKHSMTQTALTNVLDYIESTALNQSSRLTQEQADDLAREIDSSVWQSLRSNILK
ncbi:MAG: hypothetical protein NTY50_14675 [Methylobacter sp.]|nr:hypothetical protein [Methylobacter sp.]